MRIPSDKHALLTYRCLKQTSLGAGLAIIALLMALLAPTASAQDEEEGVDPEAPGTIYVPIRPPFVVNYGGQGRLRYLKAEITLRVTKTAADLAIRHHMPFIRNQIILLFSKQPEEVLDTQEGKELLRQEALQTIKTLIEEEDGPERAEEIEDLYFNQMVIQK